MKVIKIQDIIVDLSLVKLIRVADESGLSLAYVSQLLNPHNKRKNEEALKAVRDAIVKLYANAVRYCNDYEHAAAA